MANAIPTLLAYSAPMSLTRKGPFKHLAASWLVPCEFCGRLHTHGTAEARGCLIAHQTMVRMSTSSGFGSGRRCTR